MSPRETVDKNMGGIAKPMREQTDEPAIKSERHTGWLNWAGQHPGVLLLGALVMAILALRGSPRIKDRDPSDEEVPLFV